MIQNAESEAFKLRASAQILSDFKAFFFYFFYRKIFFVQKMPREKPSNWENLRRLTARQNKHYKHQNKHYKHSSQVTHKHTLLAFVCWAHILYGVDLFLPFAGSAFSPFAGVSFYVTFFLSFAGCLLCLGLPCFFVWFTINFLKIGVATLFAISAPSFFCVWEYLGCVRASLFRFFFWGGARCDGCGSRRQVCMFPKMYCVMCLCDVLCACPVGREIKWRFRACA